MMRTTIFIVGIIALMSCNKPEKSEQLIKLSENFRKSTFIKIDNESKPDYAEIEFLRNNMLVIRSDKDGQVGPFEYKISENILTFNKLEFSITPNTDGSVNLKGNEEEFILYPILFSENTIGSNQIDPFYLRRCCFLVHLNFIAMDDAIIYLNEVGIPVDSMPEEEIIFTN